MPGTLAGTEGWVVEESRQGKESETDWGRQERERENHRTQ